MEGQEQPASTGATVVEAAAPAPRRVNLEFTGSGGEYFRIWIVNLLLTIATLGIYSAWAKVRKQRYLYGNTRLDGHSFEYHGTPKAILRGRIIASVLLLLYVLVPEVSRVGGIVVNLLLIVALPWIVVRARQFALRVTSWRGVRFDFHSSYSEAGAVYLLGPLLVVLSLGLMLPWFVRRRFRWLIDRASFGTTAFRTDTTVGPYFAIALKTFGLTLLTFVAALLVVGSVVVGLGMGVTLTPELLKGDAGAGGAGVWVAFLMIGYAAIVATGLVVGAFWRSRTLNYTVSNTTLGPHRLGFALRARELALIYGTNLLGVVFTLGLFTPFAVIRVWRYQAEHGSVTFAGTADEFIASQSAVPRATGEEVGEMLDVDLGL